MSESSRRRFIQVAGTGTAAAGVAALIPAGSAGAADRDGNAENDRPLSHGAAPRLVVHVLDAHTGEMTLMGDGHAVTIHDPKLAARLAQALHDNGVRDASSNVR